MSAGGIAVVVIAEQRTSLDFAAGMHWQGVGLELVESFAGSRLSTCFLSGCFLSGFDVVLSSLEKPVECFQ